MIKTIQKCRVCGNEHLAPVIDLGKQHVQGAFEKEGVATPPRRKIPNEIVRCDTSKKEDACGTVQARHSIDPEILYRNYWYQSGISQTMRDHLQKIVSSCSTFRNVVKHGPIKKALDIACNDGTLLRFYEDSVEKWGVDPSDIAGKQKDLNIINECFPTSKMPTEPAVMKLGKGDEKQDYKYETRKRFDVVTTIACFYDVHDPVKFAQEVSNLLNKGGLWCVEMAYWPAMLEKLAYDQILGEHIVHYHLGAFEAVCEKAGLKVLHARETPTNGGSILIYVGRRQDSYEDFNMIEKSCQDNLKELRLKEFDLALDEDEIYAKFRDQVASASNRLKNSIRFIRWGEKTVHILGASTKLNVILERAGIDGREIEFAAERSVEKHGAKTLSGIKIISEEESRALKPDYYLVGPYSFKKELIEREKEFLDNGGTLIFPLPELTFVSKDGEVKYTDGCFNKGKFEKYENE